jgi:TusA-related sulfurtransferase
MLSTIVECDLKDIKNGMELEVIFDDVSLEISLPKWKPLRK